MIRLALLAFAVVALVGCKPPKFDQSITCDNGFSAYHVSAYSADARRVYVLHEDKSYEVLVDETCIISGGGK